MRKFKRFLKTTAVGRFALIVWRFRYAARYFAVPALRIFPWLVRSRELSNFTYDLSDLSKKTLASFISSVSGVEEAQVAAYIAEVGSDEHLRQHVRERTLTNELRYIADADGKPGKRLLYYALVRAMKPRVVVEAGVDKGFGTCIMAAALERNAREGFPGHLYGVDLSPAAGYLFQPPYSVRGSITCADVCEFLRQMTVKIDLYIHDSTGDPEAERREFALLTTRLAKGGIVCSAWHTDALLDWALQTRREYLVYHEQPKDHWYPGALMGTVFDKRISSGAN